MNQQEKKYAKGRVDQILARKQAAIRGKHTTKPVYLTPTQRAVALRKGEFKVPSSKVDRMDRICQVIEFTVERNGSVNEEKRDAELAALSVEYHRVMDELMLGDSQEAIKLIAAFDK